MANMLNHDNIICQYWHILRYIAVSGTDKKVWSFGLIHQIKFLTDVSKDLICIKNHIEIQYLY